MQQNKIIRLKIGNKIPGREIEARVKFHQSLFDWTSQPRIRRSKPQEKKLHVWFSSFHVTLQTILLCPCNEKKKITMLKYSPGGRGAGEGIHHSKYKKYQTRRARRTFNTLFCRPLSPPHLDLTFRNKANWLRRLEGQIKCQTGKIEY